jgi:hypothetical protein
MCIITKISVGGGGAVDVAVIRSFEEYDYKTGGYDWTHLAWDRNWQ